MAQLNTNDFSSYNLTKEEELIGSIFTQDQLYVLQNLLAANSQEKLNLTFDVNNINSFIQEDAYKRGQLDILKYLIDTSIEANRILNDPNLREELELNLNLDNR